MNVGAGMNISINKIQLAMEWDQIEYFLQKDDVWYFLTGGHKEYSSRIELIIEVNEKIDDSLKGDYWLFNKYFNDKNTLNKKWEGIKTTFKKFQNWYTDHEIYHLVGYLASTETIKLKELIDDPCTTKKDFKELLKGKIKNQESNIELSQLSYDSKKHHHVINNALLLFNIITLINQEEKQTRFPFDRYKKESWDVEHISSQAGDDIKSEDVKKVLDWIKDHPVMRNEYNPFLEKEVGSNSQWFENEPLLKEKWPKLIRDLNPSKGNTSEDIDFESQKLGNLTLLNRSINRSYKNLPFYLKRQWIIDKESKGVFIPLCTRNVFLKYYSEGYSDLLKWSQSDADSYLRKIQDTLEEYLSK